MSSDPLRTQATSSTREPSFEMSTGQLGLIILLVALGILFAATLVAYVITRAQVDFWRDPEAGLPGGLFASTLLLGGVSSSMHWAHSSIRQNREETLKRALWLSLAFAVAFLVGQGFNWSEIAHQELSNPRPTLFAFTFYLLTGLHAAHVIAGFVPLGVVLFRAHQREYSGSRYEGVKFCVQYWHFLGVVWLILLATMYIAT